MLSVPVRCSLPCASAGSSPCTALISSFDKSAHVALFGTAGAASSVPAPEAGGDGCRAVCRAFCVSLLEPQAKAASAEQSRSVNVVGRTGLIFLILCRRRLRRVLDLLSEVVDALARPVGHRARLPRQSDVLLCGCERVGVPALALAHAAEVNEELGTPVAHQLGGAREGFARLRDATEMFVEASEVVEGDGVARALLLYDGEEDGGGLLVAAHRRERVAEFDVGGREVAAVGFDGAAVERDCLVRALFGSRRARAHQKRVSLLADYKRAQRLRGRTRIAQDRDRISLDRRGGRSRALLFRHFRRASLVGNTTRASLYGQRLRAAVSRTLLAHGGDVCRGDYLAARDRDLARYDRAPLIHARAKRVEYREAPFGVAVFGECARERDGSVRVFWLKAKRALPLGDGESRGAAQRVQSSEVVARLRVRVVLKAERRLQSLLSLVPATEPREHDAEVVLCARVVAVTLRDGLSVSLYRRVRLAETRQRIPGVVEEGRVEPLLGKHLSQKLDGLTLAP